MARKVCERSYTLRLRNLVERAPRRSNRSGRGLWEKVEGGETFAGLFPDLADREIVITGKGLSITEPRMMLAVQVLQAWGYL